MTTPTHVEPPPVTPTQPDLEPDSSSSVTRWLIRIGVLAGLTGCAAVMFADISREAVGYAAIAMLLLLMFIKVPVAVALSVPGVLGLYALHGDRAAVGALDSLAYESVSSWSLSVLPMFVFMGLLLWKSGITTAIYKSARHWLGWLPGGLAIGTNTAGAGLAAVSGSTIATTYALARIGIPEMLKSGYDRRLAVGAVVVAGLPGQLIPPSIFLVIYAGIAQVPVGPQLIAGIGPGILVAACCGGMILAISLVRPALAGRTGNHSKVATVTWRERWRSLAAIWPVPALMIAVVGSMFAGVLTATEAGAAGAFGAVLLTLHTQRRNRPLAAIGEAATETVRTVGAIFFLIIGAHALSGLLALSGITTGFADWISALGLSRVEFLLIMMLAYLIMGMFLDPLSMMLLTVPVLIPTLETLDISLLWFGIFAVLMSELAIITPPVGILSFIIHNICEDPEVNLGQSITLGDVFRSVAWFLPIVLVFAGILIAYPEIATYLPSRM